MAALEKRRRRSSRLGWVNCRRLAYERQSTEADVTAMQFAVPNRIYN